MAEFKKPPPLDIKCTLTDCDNDLHCFKQLKKMTPEQRGKSRACGADLVDWKRLHRRDKADAEHTFQALQHQLIRHHFFHRPVDEGALRHAQRKGRIGLKGASRDRLRKKSCTRRGRRVASTSISRFSLSRSSPWFCQGGRRLNPVSAATAVPPTARSAMATLS